MSNSYLSTSLQCALIVAAMGAMLATIVDADAQSDIVLMTADLPAPGESKLVRFDSGSETFAVDTGTDPAFLGVTILSGDVLVADFRNEQIQRFAPDGTYLGPFASSIVPTFLESDSSLNVYSTPFSLSGIFAPPVATRLNSAGVVTGTFAHPNLTVPAGVDADALGNVYVVDSGGSTGELYKFASNGTFLNSISLGTINPNDVAIDEAGNRLFLADEFGAGLGIKVFDISGAIPIPLGSIATPVSANIVGVHYAAESGNILATDFGVGSGDPRGLELSPGGILLAEYRPANIEVALDIVTMIPEPNSVLLLFVGAIGWVTPRRFCRRP